LLAFGVLIEYILCSHFYEIWLVDTIKDRWLRVQERASNAAIRAGRDPSSVRVMAVSKTMPLERIIEARDAGVILFGENRSQEAIQKFGSRRENFLAPDTELHLVGHLQSNKARKAFDLFDMIHSLDSLKLAEVLSRIAVETNRSVPVLIEVNTSGEESKFGVPPDQVLELVLETAAQPNIKLLGFMTVGAWLPDPEAVRPCFRRLRDIRDRIEAQKIPNISTSVLSMGMTNDFEVAIEEGSTMVRIGTAIFGPREV
jgi:pyridoxal phosphate enzyme (YggS family)